jgi:hypothetical protein
MTEIIELTFSSIESNEYSARMNIVSHIEMLKSMIREDTSYKRLRDFMEVNPASIAEVRTHFNGLSEKDAERKFEHENDIAFFVYILALVDQTKNAWMECGKMACKKNLWWTKALINELMNPKLF